MTCNSLLRWTSAALPVSFSNLRWASPQFATRILPCSDSFYSFSLQWDLVCNVSALSVLTKAVMFLGYMIGVLVGGVYIWQVRAQASRVLHFCAVQHFSIGCIVCACLLALCAHQSLSGCLCRWVTEQSVHKTSILFCYKLFFLLSPAPSSSVWARSHPSWREVNILLSFLRISTNWRQIKIEGLWTD